MQAYTPEIYRAMQAASRAAAERIAPLLDTLVQPASVVDFGCGTGDWLAAFAGLGATDVLGYEGEWVDPTLLAVPQERVHVTDLRRPVALPRQYDLALCLEVVGHVPAPYDQVLLETLTRAAPVVAFSGPIPPQGGIGDDATNRRWPAHWVAEFNRRSYVAVDCLRPAVLGDPDVPWWFQQNLFVAVRREALPRYPRLVDELARHGGKVPAYVHPDCCEQAVAEAGRLRNASLGGLARGGVHALTARVRSVSAAGRRAG